MAKVELRTYRYKAAGLILNQVSRAPALKVWATRRAKPSDTRKVAVAGAWKLSVVLHGAISDGSEFR
jgi:hypothetical protein